MKPFLLILGAWFAYRVGRQVAYDEMMERMNGVGWEDIQREVAHLQ